MKLQPILYTHDMDRSVAWYGAVLGAEPGYASAVWTSIPVAGGALGLHRADEGASLEPGAGQELSLIASEPLEAIVERLAGAGITPDRGIADEAFGRSLILRDPDGRAIQLNEHAH